MSTLYEIVELANGDIALQKEGDAKKVTNGAPLVTMRFSTDLLRFLRGAKMDIAKVMIEAGLERVANLAESAASEPVTQMHEIEKGEGELEYRRTDARSNRNQNQSKAKTAPAKHPSRRASDRLMQSASAVETSEQEERHPIISHLLH